MMSAPIELALIASACFLAGVLLSLTVSFRRRQRRGRRTPKG